MDGDAKYIADKISAIEAALNKLEQRVEVQAAGETGHRALSLEKLETLKLTVQNSAMQQTAEATQHYDRRITIIENMAQQHIKNCDDENRKLEVARNRWLNQFYALWVGMILVILGMIGQFILKSNDTPITDLIIRRLEQVEQLLKQRP